MKEHIQFLIDNNFNLEMKNTDGLPLFHTVVESKDIDAINLMCDKSVSCLLKDKNEDNVFHLLALKNGKEWEEIVHILLENGHSVSQALRQKNNKRLYPVEVAARIGNFCIFSLLFCECNYLGNHKKKLIEFVREHFLKIGDETRKNYRDIWRLLTSADKGFQMDNESSPIDDWLDHDVAKKKEMQRQQETTLRFFRVFSRQGKSMTHRILKEKSKEIFDKLCDAAANEIHLDDSSARSVVIALKNYLYHKKIVPTKIFLIGGTRLLYEPASEESRTRMKGNALLYIDLPKFVKLNIKYVDSKGSFPSYGKETMKVIDEITGKYKKAEREKKLAKLLRERSQTIKSFQLSDFNKFGLIKLEKDKDPLLLTNSKVDRLKETIHFLNFLNFLCSVLEVVRRLYRDKKGCVPEDGLYFFGNVQRSEKLPVASGMARIFELLEKGRLSFDDVFGADPGLDDARNEYGIVMGKNTLHENQIEQTEAKFFKVNQKMEQHHRGMFKSQAKEFSNGDYFATRRGYLRIELRDYYGGDEESSGYDYSDDSSSAEEIPTAPFSKMTIK